MATTLWCVPCGADGRHVAASVDVDGDPMCRPCADYMQAQMIKGGFGRLPESLIEAKPEPVRATLASCPKGCGKPAHHRGRCAGYQPGPRQARAEIPQHAPAPEPAEEIDVPITRKLCAQGCGRPVHMGRCRGTVPPPKSEAALQRMREQKPVVRDTLEFDVVDEAEVPGVDEVERRVGRMGEIRDQLDKLAVGKFLKVKNRSRAHLGTTARSLRETCGKHGHAVELLPRGTDLFVRYSPSAAGRKA